MKSSLFKKAIIKQESRNIFGGVASGDGKTDIWTNKIIIGVGYVTDHASDTADPSMD